MFSKQGVAVTCKGIHTRLKGVIYRSQYFTKDEENRPSKYCSVCEYYIFTNNLRCECCIGKFRVRPAKQSYRNYKRRIQEKKNKNEIIYRII